MKPEETDTKDDEAENSAPVTGDVIGDTAYSERFVLKILLKLANLNTLKKEIQEKSFEDDLCTLWDMTAERDVVLFLQKHDVLQLFHFVLPAIEPPRVVEIIVGIVGNMCCQKEVVSVLLKMDKFLFLLLDYVKTENSLVIIQVLRLVNSSLFIADDKDLSIWMDLFAKIDYSTALYFDLKNSSKKELLVTALENLNTVSYYLNTDLTRASFFSSFVTPEALECLCAAFKEVTINQRDMCEREELERVQVISLQMTLNFVGFEQSIEIYEDVKDDVTIMICQILSYYENKVSQKEIDSDLVDIIDCTVTIINVLQLSRNAEPESYCYQSYKMWKALKVMMNTDQNKTNFEEDDKEELLECSKRMKSPLCTLICMYLEKCSEDNLLKALDQIGVDFEDIVSSARDKKIQKAVTERAARHRIRVKDNVDSQ